MLLRSRLVDDEATIIYTVLENKEALLEFITGSNEGRLGGLCSVLLFYLLFTKCDTTNNLMVPAHFKINHFLENH